MAVGFTRQARQSKPEHRRSPGGCEGGREGRTLAECQCGDDICIVNIAPDEPESDRLRELGLYEGSRARIVSAGDPVVLAVFANRFAVCRRSAGRVVCEVGGPVQAADETTAG